MCPPMIFFHQLSNIAKLLAKVLFSLKGYALTAVHLFVGQWKSEVDSDVCFGHYFEGAHSFQGPTEIENLNRSLGP